MYKAALFDVDGVLNVQSEFFSHTYARENNLNIEALEHFFKGVFIEASLGRRDLVELITENHDAWRWDQDPQILLQNWFKSENAPNKTLLEIVSKVRKAGIPVYLATQQEKYRAQYIREVMYPGLFDDEFITCEIGYDKSSPEFFRAVIERLQVTDSSIVPAEIVYFDDRQNLIDIARTLGIDGYLYDDTVQVAQLLGV